MDIILYYYIQTHITIYIYNMYIHKLFVNCRQKWTYYKAQMMADIYY